MHSRISRINILVSVCDECVFAILFLDLQAKVDVDKCTNGSDSSDSGVHVNLGKMDIGYVCFIEI